MCNFKQLKLRNTKSSKNFFLCFLQIYHCPSAKFQWGKRGSKLSPIGTEKYEYTKTFFVWSLREKLFPCNGTLNLHTHQQMVEILIFLKLWCFPNKTPCCLDLCLCLGVKKNDKKEDIVCFESYCFRNSLLLYKTSLTKGGSIHSCDYFTEQKFYWNHD